ncbi:MAG: hypothetical protein JWO36_1564 [Myxococcales bacterium]|nr:hypothetical protein [Myxococcales bacterium]
MRAPLVLALVSLTTPALAGRNEITVGGGERALRSSSADAVTPDSMSGSSLSYARALDIDVIPQLTLWAEGSFVGGSAKGLMFQSITTDLATTVFMAGGRARYTLHQYIAVSARVDLGSARTSLSLEDSSGRKASATGWSSIAAAATALDLLPIDLPQFALGVRLELGYVAARGVELTPKRETTGDTLMLPVSQSSFGKLDLSGPYFGISVISQF